MISVCMATYNGEKYIVEQIESILRNLSIEDELIISDDGSTDDTLNIVKNYEQTDKRVKLLMGPCEGVIANFENAIAHAKGAFIYLSDQDDVWTENKCAVVQKTFFGTDALVIVHDAMVVDKDKRVLMPSFYAWRHSGPGLWHNFYKNSYTGCCMSFRKELLSSILPLPRNIEMHDQWIGMWGEIRGRSVFCSEKLLMYRRHGNNVSEFYRHSIGRMMKNRINLLINLVLNYLR